MATIKIGEHAWNVSENAMVLIGTNDAGEVKNAIPFGGSPENKELLNALIEKTVGQNGITRALIVRAQYVYVPETASK